MARVEPLYYYRWFWRDWRSNRRVQRMHYISRGFYRELLDEQWAEGSIPTDMAALADICGCPVQVMKEYWSEISPHFEDDGNGNLIHPKLESIRTEMDAERAKKSRAGRASAESKRNKNSIPKQISFIDLPNTVETPSTPVDCVQLALEKKREEKQCSVLPCVETPIPISPEMITRGVMSELAISGRELSTVLDDICKAEMKRGKAPTELRDALIGAYRDYENSKSMLTYTKGIAKFFGDGDWRGRKGWPWKEKIPGSSRPLTFAEQRALEATN